MKTILFLTFFLINILTLTHPVSVGAQACVDIINPTECGYRPDCLWNGSCIVNTNPHPVGLDRVSDHFSIFDPLQNRFSTPADIINQLLPYLFTIAGLILFAMLIAGGFQMLTAATNPKAADAGKARITHAIIGFIIIFTAYWLTQIMEIILGIKIL
jgi:hypothetical protein